jgi:tetrahydromethanopterin S-methyltransferase subunit E
MRRGFDPLQVFCIIAESYADVATISYLLPIIWLYLMFSMSIEAIVVNLKKSKPPPKDGYT